MGILILAVLIVVGGAVALVGGLMLRDRLGGMVSSHLHAELKMGMCCMCRLMGW